MIEQVLSDQALTANKFRGWKEANVALVQDICARQSQQGAAEAGEAAAPLGAAPVVETSLWAKTAGTLERFLTHCLWIQKLTAMSMPAEF